MTEGRQLSRRERGLLWFGVLGPVAAWTAQLTIGYAYEEAACSNATGDAIVEPLIAAVTVACAAIAVAAGAGAAGLWLGVRRGEIADPRERIALMALFGVATSVILLLAIAMGGLQLVAFGPCSIG